MGEGEVAHPQLVHGAQRSQAAVERVPTLNADKTCCLVLSEGRLDVCRVGALHISLEIVTHTTGYRSQKKPAYYRFPILHIML